MTAIGRALMGAAVGGFIVLVLHPATRPIILSLPLQNASELPTLDRQLRESLGGAEENSTIGASVESCNYATARLKGRRSSPAYLERLRSLLGGARQAEPDNAFWTQMLAVIELESGRAQRATELWIRASSASSWNDHQSARLTRLANQFDSKIGTSLAWHLGIAYFARVPANAQVIANSARTLISGRGLDESKDVQLRLATLRNGILMREGGRSIAVGRIALKLCDLAAFSNQERTLDARKQYEARYAFKTRVAEFAGQEAGQECEKAFINNEGWYALTSTEEAEESPVELTGYAGLTAALPGVLLALALAGAVVWILVSLAKGLPRMAGRSLTTYALLALVLGLAAAWLSGMLVIGILVAATTMLQAVPTEGTERRALKTLGTLFELAVFAFGLVIGTLLVFLLYGETAPGSATLTLLGVPEDYVGVTRHMVSVILLIVGLFLIVPPIWGAAHRVSTHQVLALMLRQLSLGIATWCFVGAVALTPISYKLDGILANRLRPLQENEPLYYVNR